MDTNFIYTKTPAGEEAIRQRTHVMQRNVRMVLILVDGSATFQDLCLRTGNVKLTEAALLELEQGGFIIPQVEQPSVWDEGKKIVQGIRSAATTMATPEKSAAAKGEKPRQAARRSDPETEILSNLQFSLAPQETSYGASKMSPRLSGSSLSDAYPLLNWSVSDFSTPDGQAPQETLPPEKLSLRERFRWLFLRFTKDEAETSSSGPTRSASGKSFGWGRVLLLLLLVAGGVSYLALLFFPYAAYLPEIEAALSRNLGQTTKVTDVQVDFRPVPTLSLRKVRIETGDGGVAVKELTLEPVLTSLISPVKVFRKAVLRGVDLPATAFPALAAMSENMARPEADGRVESVRLEQVDIHLVGLDFPGMEGELLFSGSGKLESAAFRTPDRSLKISLKGGAPQTDVLLEGLAWQPVPDMSLVVDSATLKGQLLGDALTLQSLELRLLEGVLQGSGGVQVTPGRGVALRGDVDFSRINGNRLEGLWGKAAIFSGDLSGRLHVSARAEAWSGIGAALLADGDFSVQRGSLKGIDLIEAMRRASSGDVVQGGATAFEQLSGKYRYAAGRHQYSGVVMSSGLMQASGAVQTDGKEHLSGHMELQMRGSAIQTRAPITISGSPQVPLARIARP